jgi:DNA-directed RNA polymerase sigma subunit (sigma70/sigma32)
MKPKKKGANKHKKKQRDKSVQLVYDLIKTLKPPENRIVELCFGKRGSKSAKSFQEAADFMGMDKMTLKKIYRAGIRHLIKKIRDIKKQKNRK